MINCLSSSKFANLLFVNVQIGNVNAIALFDTGAGHETEIAGVGTSQYKRIPYVRELQLWFQNQTITLQDVDICDKLCGQSEEIEALLEYDFLEGRDWLLEQAFRLLP